MPNDPDKIQHGLTPDVEPWDALLLELGRDIERVADRLRGLSDVRLAAAAPPYPSRAAAARATAQVLADAAAGLEAAAESAGPDAAAEADDPDAAAEAADPDAARDAPVWRELPELSDLSAGDQLAVTGHDLQTAARSTAPQDLIWARHGRRTAQEALTEATAALAALRRLL